MIELNPNYSKKIDILLKKISNALKDDKNKIILINNKKFMNK
jgi:hypothetical protein